jgi:hypothetical protein
MGTVSSKYNMGDKAYYVLFATTEIIPIEIIRIHYNSNNCIEPVSYMIQFTNRIKPTYIDFVEESKLLTYAQAKNYLISWLDSQKLKISSLTEPTL